MEAVIAQEEEVMTIKETVAFVLQHFKKSPTSRQGVVNWLGRMGVEAYSIPGDRKIYYFLADVEQALECVKNLEPVALSPTGARRKE